MIAKVTGAAQLTLPAQILKEMGQPDYFSVSVEEGRLVLTPAQPKDAEDVREYLQGLGITEQDVVDAIQYARHNDKSPSRS